MQAHKPAPPVYEIRVEGEFGQLFTDWFEGLSFRSEFNAQERRATTVLYGPIRDQSALHGVLDKIRDLNLTLISVEKKV